LLVLLRKFHPGFARLLAPAPTVREAEGPTEAERYASAARSLLASVPKLTELLSGQLEETNRVSGESALAVLNQIALVQAEASRLLSTLGEVKVEASAMCGNAQTLIKASRRKLEEMGAYTRAREAEIRDDSEAIQRIVVLTKELAPMTGLIGSLCKDTRLIALNASIQAANDHSVDRGFVAVAEEMRRLAVEIGSASAQVDEVMRRIARTVEERLVDMVSIRRIETEKDWLHGLTESMTRMSGDFEAAVFGQDRLSKDCHSAVQNLFAAVLKTHELSQFQDIFRQQLEQVQNGLALVGERLGRASEPLGIGSETEFEPLDDVLVALEKTYTMRTQRNVHDAIVLEKHDGGRDAGPAIELF